MPEQRRRRAKVAPAEPQAVLPHDADSVESLAAIADRAGIRRVHFVAWRDLDDPEAGGSELHAHRIASQWAAAGIDVTFRTSAVPGAPRSLTRDNYRVLRQAGRYRVFPAAAWEGLRMGHRPGDALVEIWNGMPFFSPLWYRGPRLVFLHHVHAEMWGMVLPPTLARAGDALERRIAPTVYRGSRIVTLSESSRQEIVEMLGLDASRITVAPPGVDARYSPSGERSATPLVVAVGRLVPVKRFDLLLHALAAAKTGTPDLQAVIVGEGYERPALERLRAELGAEDWISFPGRVHDDELLDWYRKAWVVASTSQREGWGMTLTEAAACGTPAVATAIAGHNDAVLSGESGLLVDDPADVGDALSRVLTDDVLRSRLSRGALDRARWFTWPATARRALEALAEESDRRR
jgi:glycosyltransferase involved in cell wall biosynthesis